MHTQARHGWFLMKIDASLLQSGSKLNSGQFSSFKLIFTIAYWYSINQVKWNGQQCIGWSCGGWAILIRSQLHVNKARSFISQYSRYIMYVHVHTLVCGSSLIHVRAVANTNTLINLLHIEQNDVIQSCALLNWIYFRFRCGTGKLKCHRFLTTFCYI